MGGVGRRLLVLFGKTLGLLRGLLGWRLLRLLLLGDI